MRCRGMVTSISTANETSRPLFPGANDCGWTGISMKRKTYPLRINPDIMAATQRWANDDLRSLNAQIEFVLRESLIRAGRYRPDPERPSDSDPESSS